MDLHLEATPPLPMAVSHLSPHKTPDTSKNFILTTLLGWGKEQSAHGIALWFHRFIDESFQSGRKEI